MSLSHVVFWLAVAACVIAQIAIVRASVATVAGEAHGTGVPKPARRAELLWVVLPALLLALALVLTWRALERERHVHSSFGIAPAHDWRGGLS